jgi:RNA polymerase sigma factor (sigma-70 family)
MDNSTSDKFRGADVNPEMEAKLLEIMANRNYWLKLTMKFGKGSLSTADCEDVLQEAFCLAAKNIGEFRGKAKLETWLAEILKNNVRMYFRARVADKRDERKTVALEFSQLFISSSETVEEIMMDLQQRLKLQEEIGKMPPTHQTILNLLMEDKNHQEIADITGMTYTAMSNQRLRAVRNLKEKLADFEEN